LATDIGLKNERFWVSEHIDPSGSQEEVAARKRDTLYDAGRDESRGSPGVDQKVTELW
jgi:hypothetical protein